MSDSSKKRILQSLASQNVESVPLPNVLEGDWIRYDDPVSQLVQVVQFVGGSAEVHPDLQSVRRRLEEFPEVQNASRILSLVPDLPGNVDLDATLDPKELEDLDFVMVRGEFAVAENGAVWVTDRNLRHRVIYFINQHLIMVVSKSSILHNMHEAYSQLTFSQPGFGCFISGPSKTADIEQSLVIGAHGCRSMQLYVIDG